MTHHPNHASGSSGWRSPAKIALYVFLGIIAFFLVTEHLAHLIPVLPWTFLLLCPLMHLFMHGGHGGHGGGDDQSGSGHAGHGGGNVLRGDDQSGSGGSNTLRR